MYWRIGLESLTTSHNSQVMQSEFPHSSLWMQSPALSSDRRWKRDSKLAERGGWQPLPWCPIEKVGAPTQLLSDCFPRKSLFPRMPLKAAGSPRQVASPQGEGSPIRLKAFRSSIRVWTAVTSPWDQSQRLRTNSSHANPPLSEDPWEKKRFYKNLLKAFCVQVPCSSIAPGMVPGVLFSNNKM